MSETVIPINIIYDDARSEIREGDLIVFRNRFGKPVRAMKACRWGDPWYAVEVRKYLGVAAIPLEQLVQLTPGRIDVYEVNPDSLWENYDRQGAMRYLKGRLFTEKDRRLTLVETLYDFLSKLFGKEVEKRISTPYGLEAIHLAERLGGGVEPLPDLAHAKIRVQDLLESSFYRYRFTLK